MSEVIGEWIQQIVHNEAVLQERQLRLLVRPRPRWLPEPAWRWLLARLLFLEERRL